MTRKIHYLKNGLKSSARQELERRGVQELSKAMMVAKFMVKLGLGKDKLESFKFEEGDICEGNHEEDNGNGNSSDGRESLTKRGKCPKKSTVKGDNGSDKAPKKLGLSKGKVETNRAKRRKKKRVKCFLCRGSHELRDSLKKSMVKEKATTELVESLEGLPPKEEVKLASDEEEVAMQTLKLEPMKLNSKKAIEFVKSSVRLPPKQNVSYASDLEEKVAM
ncbi:hypothetical protein J1N35_035492 [Gossypium stocksii]|uniref:Uncharacterized protein n=1 Tax=Gossypium stocksii TaxID=47602 RepID=A0A9D3ZRJ1_9ROSI|nr:hypothetical protein J1N35_035492 [Gossypium stocksii]